MSISESESTRYRWTKKKPDRYGYRYDVFDAAESDITIYTRRTFSDTTIFTHRTLPFSTYVCVIHIKPFFLPVDIFTQRNGGVCQRMGGKTPSIIREYDNTRTSIFRYFDKIRVSSLSATGVSTDGRRNAFDNTAIRQYSKFDISIRYDMQQQRAPLRPGIQGSLVR